MAEPQMVDPHDVVMTGENSFIRLSNDGGSTIAERVSHWRVLWSPAGQGHALFIDSSLTGKGPRVYADNPGVARYLQRTIETLLPRPEVEIRALVPYERGDLVNRIHQTGEFLAAEHVAEGTLLAARVSPALAAELGPYELVISDTVSLD